METIFSRMLVQLRKDAGFPTAYRFYHASGGAAGLKMSYRNFLLIEQGKKLPMLDKLGTLIALLRVPAKSTEANALTAAWLKTMAGEERFAQLIEPLLAAGGGEARGQTPVQKALKKAINAKRYPLTARQIEVIYSTPDVYLCHLAMTNDTGTWPVKEFAARLKLKEAAARRALKALAAAKLVKEIKKDVYRCPLAKVLLEYPLPETLSPELRAKIPDYYGKLEATGKREMRTVMVIRADEAEFRNYMSIADDNITAAATYTITESTPRSALFLVEGKVTKLRDF